MKMDKFKTGEGGFMTIRKEVLPNGKIIAFAIAGTDLSVMQFERPIDFDAESDLIVEKHKNSDKNLTFEYVPNFGFDEVATDQQAWFNF